MAASGDGSCGHTQSSSALNYPGMKVSIRIFSALCIFFGIASIGVQVIIDLIKEFEFKFL